MILRSVTKHIRDQNWFAVGIDFLIVVVGVFIGIQVANWNQARADRAAEALYLERLHREIVEILPQAEAGYQLVRDRLERIEQVRSFLDSGTGLGDLNGAHCGALSTSHIFAETIFYPPTIRELISTGRIVLIRDHAMRTAILSFDQTNAELVQLRTDIQIDRQLLARAHPGLIDSRLSEWEDAVCNFEGMANDRAFRNDFIDNMRRFAAYVSSVTGRQAEVLRELRAMLAADPAEGRAHDTARNDQVVPQPEPEARP